MARFGSKPLGGKMTSGMLKGSVAIKAFGGAASRRAIKMKTTRIGGAAGTGVRATALPPTSTMRLEPTTMTQS